MLWKRKKKEMKYYHLSKNIIACENFLNPQNVDEIFAYFLNNRNRFNIPNWVYSNNSKKLNYIFLYLLFISIILELTHIIIPNRSFQFEDLIGNITGVIISYILIVLIY